MRKNINIKRILLISFSIFIMFGVASGQDEEPATRDIKSLDFKKKRPVKSKKIVRRSKRRKVSASRRKKIARVSSSKRRYRHTRRKTHTSRKTIRKKRSKPRKYNEELGVTFWRLRPLQEDEDDAPTYPVRIEGKRKDWTAERVNSTTEFQKGDRVRFTFESSVTGYLYIINREFYTDGTQGKANLIFPTKRTRGGDNKVFAGSLVEIPGSDDSVPYFTVKPRRSDYGGEELIVIISKNQIPIDIGLRAVPISIAMLERWFEKWKTTVDVYDAEDGEGIAETQTEKEVVNTRSLTQEEPLPQTIYRLKIPKNRTMLVTLQMRAVSKN